MESSPIWQELVTCPIHDAGDIGIMLTDIKRYFIIYCKVKSNKLGYFLLTNFTPLCLIAFTLFLLYIIETYNHKNTFVII